MDREREQQLLMERSETQQIMDQMEALVLRKGWPVPFTPYYLVHHERMLALLDKLRASLQDDMDARFLQAFKQTEYIKKSRKAQRGKER